jgi:hypothetical protein
VNAEPSWTGRCEAGLRRHAHPPGRLALGSRPRLRRWVGWHGLGAEGDDDSGPVTNGHSRLGLWMPPARNGRRRRPRCLSAAAMAGGGQQRVWKRVPDAQENATSPDLGIAPPKAWLQRISSAGQPTHAIRPCSESPSSDYCFVNLAFTGRTGVEAVPDPMQSSPKNASLEDRWRTIHKPIALRMGLRVTESFSAIRAQRI